jgi:hypothetical protein
MRAAGRKAKQDGQAGPEAVPAALYADRKTAFLHEIVFPKSKILK